jgi:nucleotide-binding universal stress UspA family protein
MLRTIAVPLDGSRFAEAALGLASRLAKEAGGWLTLVAVHEPQLALLPVADTPVATTADDTELRTERRDYLAATAGKLDLPGVDYELIDGLAGPALAKWIEAHQPDLVVMSSHGRGPLSRFWLGSVADHVVRHVSVPILLLRPHEGDGPPAVRTALGSAIVPLDLSDESEAILPPLESIARLFQTRIKLVHVVEPILGITGGVPAYPTTMTPDLVESTRTRAEQALEQIAGRLRSRGLQVSVQVVFSMGVAGAVIELLESEGAQFVALTTHGATGFRRLLLGSVADKIIRATDRPVLILQPPETG